MGRGRATSVFKPIRLTEGDLRIFSFLFCFTLVKVCGLRVQSELCFSGSVAQISDIRICHIGLSGPGGLARNVRCT